MTEFNWHDVYYSDLQSPFALWIVPLAFLAWRAAVPSDPRRAVVPRAAPFVALLTLFFTFETLLDPFATGPFLKWAGLGDAFIGTVIPFLFVLLGDLRVLLLAVGVARPERTFGQNLVTALVASLIVPIFAGLGYTLAGLLIPDVHGQVLWMLYEAGFLLLCIYASRVLVPAYTQSDPAAGDYVRAILGYSAAYYALWLAADFVIVWAELDLGWAIRIVPNQLYYAFWAPFAYWRFYSLRPSAGPVSASDAQ